MDILGTPRGDFGQEPDMSDILDSDMFGSPCGLSTSDSYMDNDWLNSLFEDPVLNDKMITEAVQPPRIQSEHSYSMHNDNVSSLELPKLEDFPDDMETEFFGTASPLDLSQKSTSPPELIIKQEPSTEDYVLAPSTSTTTPVSIEHRLPTIVLATAANSILHPKSDRLVLPKSVKIEPADSDHSSSDSGFDMLPPTPPSSASSDSEGSLSPQRSAPSSPIRESPGKHYPISKAFSQPLFTSPIPTSGVLILSEEEKRTLITEGYPIPNKLPLTKQEEKNLKKIRRKIKNKISAQESRRKKKEYLETLEKRVESYTQENSDLKRKVDSLENNNRSLLSQLQKLQSLVGKISRPSATTTQTGTVLMVVVLCFAIFVGGWAPLSMNIGYSSVGSGSASPIFTNPTPVHPAPTMGPLPQNVHVMESYSTPTKKSRVLLSLKEDLEDLYGPRLPDSGWKQEQSENQENTEHWVAPKPRQNATEGGATESPVITMDARVVDNNKTAELQDFQALMHPDIAAPAHFLSTDHFVNGTAVNESA